MAGLNDKEFKDFNDIVQNTLASNWRRHMPCGFWNWKVHN